MSFKNKKIFHIFIAVLISFASLASTVGIGSAEEGGDDPIITANIEFPGCGEVVFNINWTGTPPYLVQVFFGDEDMTEIETLEDSILEISHLYIDQGDYEWSVFVGDDTGATTTFSETLTIAGPEVTLTSQPFPPLFVYGEDGVVDFTAAVEGDPLDYTFEWDLDGDGTPEPDTGDTASFTFKEVGKYYARVTVTDLCGFTGTASLPVVVADPENACHPTAQKIADGVNTLFPDQAGDLYTCEDVYGIFDNEGEDNNIGFGRMWMAYNLAQSMEELNWEDILSWHLDQSGWGSLLQLDRFADLLEDHSLTELMDLVISEEYSLNDVRTAVRSATRYEADFDDALTRIADGATPGELTQFYKLAGDLEADPVLLDEYLEEGLTLAELKHTSNFAERMEIDWTEVADARVAADSWGDINQAYRLATDEVSAAEILITGIKEFRESLRDEAAEDRQEKGEEKKEEKSKETAEKLAEQYSAESGDVINLFNGECQGDWACVRETLRDQERDMSGEYSEKDHQTAQQIASKYGYSEEQVLEYHEEFCGENWSCTRAHFRELYMSSQDKGKPNK
jgi:hypothetical protein